MALIASMSMRGKLTLAGCVLGFLAACVLILKLGSSPSYTTIQTGLDPTKSSQITSALAAAGVNYQLTNAGTALEVKSGQQNAALTALASKGLNTTATQPGFEILDKQKLGASNQQQQVAYMRGLEGEIANTISQINGASGATVNLTLSQDNLFASDSLPATAAVLIPGSGDALDPSAVRGIANLVASSVPGLKTSAVTITDGTGAMLWPNGDTGTTGSASTKTAAEGRYDTSEEAQLQSMLDSMLGPGMAQVQVHADMNVDKVSQQSLTYARKGVPLTQTQSAESLKGTGTVSGGTSGTASNLPSYTASASSGSGSNNNYKNSTTTTNYGYDKTATSTQKAAGAINSQQVSVILNNKAKLTPAQLRQLQTSLGNAVGLTPSRGDKLSLTTMPFVAQTATRPAATGLPIPAAFQGILKGLGIGLGALMFLFFVTRHLRRRERGELIDEPSWLRSLEAASPRPELMPMPDFAPQGAATDVSIATADPRRQQLDNLIHDEPERVAAHLRQWVTEDNK